MAIDAYSKFLADWDIILVEEWKRTNNEMAVLTTYPMGYDWDAGGGLGTFGGGLGVFLIGLFKRLLAVQIGSGKPGNVLFLDRSRGIHTHSSIDGWQRLGRVLPSHGEAMFDDMLYRGLLIWLDDL